MAYLLFVGRTRRMTQYTARLFFFTRLERIAKLALMWYNINEVTTGEPYENIAIGDSGLINELF